MTDLPSETWERKNVSGQYTDTEIYFSVSHSYSNWIDYLHWIGLRYEKLTSKARTISGLTRLEKSSLLLSQSLYPSQFNGIIAKLLCKLNRRKDSFHFIIHSLFYSEEFWELLRITYLLEVLCYHTKVTF